MTGPKIAVLAVLTLLGLVAAGVAIAAADAPSEAARPTAAVDDDGEVDDDADEPAEAAEIDDDADEPAAADDESDDATERNDDADEADAAEENIAPAVADRAGAAGVKAAGGGTVNEVEREESGYEVEVTRPDGTEAEVQLDQAFSVVSVEQDD